VHIQQVIKVDIEILVFHMHNFNVGQDLFNVEKILFSVVLFTFGQVSRLFFFPVCVLGKFSQLLNDLLEQGHFMLKFLGGLLSLSKGTLKVKDFWLGILSMLLSLFFLRGI
jgi:hypothetical protein